MDILQGVSIFLAVALIAFVMSTVWLAFRCNNNVMEFYDQQEHIEQLREDNKQLLSENVRLLEENQRLIIVNDELKAINTELSAPAPEPEEPELQISESNESVLSSQSENALQTDATKLKERLPEGHTNVISGMPYTSITDKKSEQWALQLQACTGKYGIRCYFDGDRIYFLSAMGSAYGRTIGDAFRVTLRCGTVLYVMLAEFKDDGTDPNFFGHPTTHADGYDVTCVLEFIYDAEHIDSKALQAGNFCNIEYFGGLHGYGGDIVKIENLGRKWEP